MTPHYGYSISYQLAICTVRPPEIFRAMHLIFGKTVSYCVGTLLTKIQVCSILLSPIIPQRSNYETKNQLPTPCLNYGILYCMYQLMLLITWKMWFVALPLCLCILLFNVMTLTIWSEYTE